MIKKESENIIISNIYQADKTVSKEFPTSKKEKYDDYLIGQYTFIRIPRNKNEKRYFIISPQSVESKEKSLEVIEVNQTIPSISFYLKKEDSKIVLGKISFDSITKNWDVRSNLVKENIPTTLEELLNEIEMKTIFENDGIIYSETFNTMIDDINNLYKKDMAVKK